jgi:hypothetical protein
MEYKEDISSCTEYSNFSYEFLVAFDADVTEGEAKTILEGSNAVSIGEKRIGNVYYVFFEDGKVCASVEELRSSKKVRSVENVPTTPM